jgi:hypothetical protein
MIRIVSLSVDREQDSEKRRFFNRGLPGASNSADIQECADIQELTEAYFYALMLK